MRLSLGGNPLQLCGVHPVELVAMPLAETLLGRAVSLRLLSVDGPPVRPFLAVPPHVGRRCLAALGAGFLASLPVALVSGVRPVVGRGHLTSPPSGTTRASSTRCMSASASQSSTSARA